MAKSKDKLRETAEKLDNKLNGNIRPDRPSFSELIKNALKIKPSNKVQYKKKKG